MDDINAIFIPDTDYVSTSSVPSPDTTSSDSIDLFPSPAASLDWENDLRCRELQSSYRESPKEATAAVDPLCSFDCDNWENWMQWDGIDLLKSPVPPGASIPESQAAYLQPPAEEGTVFIGSQSVDAIPYPEPSPMDRIAPSTEDLLNFNFPGQFHGPPTDNPWANTPTIHPQKNDPHKSIRSSISSEPYNSSISSPGQSGTLPNKKRKSSAKDDDIAPEPIRRKRLPGSKAAHNIVEKRYRMNINGKIAALRDSLPNFNTKHRIRPSRGKLEGDDEDGYDARGSGGQKINKAAVLSEAIDYIRQSEERMKKHNEEMAMMRVQLDVFRTLAAAKSTETNAHPVQTSQTQDGLHENHTSFNSQIYPATINHAPISGSPRPVGRQTTSRGGYVNRLMVGSMAGLMVMQGLGEAEQQTDAPGARGLFSLPAEFMWRLGRILQPLSLSGAPESTLLHQNVLPLFKFIVLLVAIIFILSPSFFDSKPEKETKAIPPLILKGSPSLGSPVEVRRSAWLTAIQTVWVPEQSFSKQLAALLLKFAKLGIRHTIGWSGYARLTGTTEEQEVARVRAWEIALDAQLTGGDAEISVSRLALTMLASATLPVTPYRLMLKALHIHILLREVTNSRLRGQYLYRVFATKYARYQWEKAKNLQAKIHRSCPPKKLSGSDALPDHLAALLELDIDTVIQDAVVQRACNLAWHKPTIDEADDRIDGMGSIINDPVIGSPLDAVSAWYSCLVLRQALVSFVGVKTGSKHCNTDFQKDVDLALKISPAGSLVQNYGLVVRAVLIGENRGANIAAALQALPSVSKSGNRTPTMDDTSSSSSTASHAPSELRMALQCAMAVATLQRPQYRSEAIALIEKIGLPHQGLGLLGFTAAYNLLATAFEDKSLAGETRRALENVASTLKLWVGGENGTSSGLDRHSRGEVAMLCIKVLRWLVGMSVDDQGYGSMSDG